MRRAGRQAAGSAAQLAPRTCTWTIFLSTIVLVEIELRELELIRLVARFGQLSTKHIQALIFHKLVSTNSMYKTLDRLIEARQLARIERRLAGGSRGGSGQHCIQLGLEGWKLMQAANPDDPRYQKRWQPMRAINHHSLAIADTFVMLKQLEQGGRVSVVRYVTEPECHLTVGNYAINPDFYAELSRPGSTNVKRFMYEIDQGSEGQKQIGKKLAWYYGASQLVKGLDEEQQPVYEWNTDGLLVVFIAIDEERARELLWIINKDTPERRAMFRVRTLPALEAELS